MAGRIYTKEQKKKKLARRKILSHRGWGDSYNSRYGLHIDWSEYHEGFGYYIHRKGGKYFRRRHEGSLLSHHARFALKESDTRTLDDITFWEAQEIEQQDRLAAVKRQLHNNYHPRRAAYVRNVYNRRKRFQVLRIKYLARIGDFDAIDLIDGNSENGALWRDIY